MSATSNRGQDDIDRNDIGEAAATGTSRQVMTAALFLAMDEELLHEMERDNRDAGLAMV